MGALGSALSSRSESGAMPVRSEVQQAAPLRVVRVQVQSRTKRCAAPYGPKTRNALALQRQDCQCGSGKTGGTRWPHAAATAQASAGADTVEVLSSLRRPLFCVSACLRPLGLLCWLPVQGSKLQTFSVPPTKALLMHCMCGLGTHIFCTLGYITCPSSQGAGKRGN